MKKRVSPSLLQRCVVVYRGFPPPLPRIVMYLCSRWQCSSRLASDCVTRLHSRKWTFRMRAPLSMAAAVHVHCAVQDRVGEIWNGMSGQGGNNGNRILGKNVYDIKSVFKVLFRATLYSVSLSF
ncbi:hypothetical protein CDAR_218771 [Caerostris darwini]|uniref:Uncharacterized protein n=1 Tax=Caerostris darwini TaxID=1538125 RepID=A0AAV4UGB2_9ARAC|nr:hypothetical protein CDAR_218771 [Caerostris darwini]